MTQVAPSERYYVRHRTSGQLGWIEIHDGKQMVRIDRPSEPNNLIPYRQRDWTPEKAIPALGVHQVAVIQFEADRALCRQMGRSRFKDKSWHDLKDEERIQWTNVGPDLKLQPNRARLYHAVKMALEPLSEPESSSV